MSDGEEATATGAEVATAVTEPPRRITRGELPVVMGRLIDQVDDPEVKRALENPANPNEPKGLGTAATRDTMLPKLLKSHYIALARQGSRHRGHGGRAGLPGGGATGVPGLRRSGGPRHVRGGTGRDRARGHAGRGRPARRTPSGSARAPASMS